VPRILVDLAPLRASRDFRLLFSGQLVSMLGNQVTIVAVSYQVYHLTNSTLQVGAVSLVQLPLLVGGSLVGGTVGDVVDKRRMLTWSALALAVVTSLIALNATLAHPSLVAIYVLTAITSGLAGFSNPARNSAIPSLVPRELLIAAYSLNQVTVQVATVVGPAIGGVLAAINLPVACGASRDPRRLLVPARPPGRPGRVPP
jgi:ENTS family enterobactin (siderophore) exporter